MFFTQICVCVSMCNLGVVERCNHWQSEGVKEEEEAEGENVRAGLGLLTEPGLLLVAVVAC